MSLSVADSAFCHWSVYIFEIFQYIACKIWVSTSEIKCIDSCVLKSLFTSVHLQSVSLKPSRPTILYFAFFLYSNGCSDLHICGQGRELIDGLQNKFVLIATSEHTFIIV